MKTVLIVYYSQTGQMRELLKNFIISWKSIYLVDLMEIKCNEFSFPMKYFHFFETFPESVLKLPKKIQYKIEEKDYDCIILGVQPWFLYPSIPFQSFMQTDDFKRLVNNKPVILVLGARNSWRICLKEVVDETEKNNGNVKGIYVFRDISKNHQGFISLCYWLFTGNKRPPIKKLPTAGISQEIIDSTGIYGKTALNTIETTDCDYTVVPHIDEEFTSIKYEQYAADRYNKWAKFIQKDNFKNRKCKMFLFRIWVLFTFFVLSPLVSKKSKI